MAENEAYALSIPKQVVIIGSGVIGLTIAFELSRKYKPDEVSVTIIARDMPRDGMDSTGWASPWAGANWFPFLNQEPQNEWERVSFRRFKDDVPKEFVMDLPSKYYSANPNYKEDAWYTDIVSKFKEISTPYPKAFGSNPPAQFGAEFTTISICVPTYLPWLESEALSRGVKFVKGWVNSIADLEYVPGTEGQVKTDVIVNASGLGAKSIIGVSDPLVHSIRGQTVLVRAPDIKWCLMGMGLYTNAETGESIYIIPRPNGDVVVGGTFQPNNWDVSPDPGIARGILERALTYCPELATPPGSDPESDISRIQVLRHNVGLRPARTGGARVEKELVTIPTTSHVDPWSNMTPTPSALCGADSSPDAELKFKEMSSGGPKQFKVVHAYGVGPAGYQESWGVAESVVRLVSEFF